MNKAAVRPMLRHAAIWLPLLWVMEGSAGSGLGAQSPGTPDSSRVECEILKKQGEWPEYTSSGIWTSKGNLLLLDSARRRLLRFSTDGKSEGAVSGELGKRLELGTPRRVASTRADELYIQTDHNRFTLTAPWLPRPKDVVAGLTPSGGIISKVYNYAVVGDEVIAFADVEEQPGQWQWGFVVFPKEQPAAFRWLVKGLSTAERTFFRLPLALITAIGDTAYVLRMEGRPEIHSYTKGAETLEPLHLIDGYSEQHLLPQLPTFLRPTDFEHVMRAVERSTMPGGLYGWEGKLYLLTRTWVNGYTTWSFVIIDPSDPDLKLETIPIKVNAEHLFAIPGRQQWGLVAKAHPTGQLAQKVTTIRFFRSAALRASPLPAQICN